MDPTNKFWWFAGVSILVTLLIFVGIAIFFWQQLLPDQQATLIEIVKIHFIYIFIALILFMAAIGFGLDAIFHSYILPLNRLPEEIELIHTVNSAHRIKRDGSKLVNLVIDAINENLGHVKGQMILKNFSAAVQQHIRKEDSCSRRGLKQLMIVRQNAGADDARQFCFRLAKALRKEQITNGAVPELPALTISAGFAEAPLGAAFDDVLANAGSRESTFLEFKIQ